MATLGPACKVYDTTAMRQEGLLLRLEDEYKILLILPPQTVRRLGKLERVLAMLDLSQTFVPGQALSKLSQLEFVLLEELC